MASNDTRVGRTISFPPDQDRWLTELLGEGGNASAFIQALVEAARTGAINMDQLSKLGARKTPLERAAAYMKSKEASMHFEEDVGAVLALWLKQHHGLVAFRSKIHNDGTPFVADFSIERADGTVVFSVACKSSPRADRLQLALGEALIGKQKTGRPVITTVPYLINESTETVEQFKSLNLPLVEMKNLAAALDRAVALKK